MTERACRIDGCDRPHHAHGVCIRHYHQLRTKTPVRRFRTDVSEVLWLLDGGRPVPSICDALGLHPDSVARALRAAGCLEEAKLFATESAIRKRLAAGKAMA